MTATLEFPSRTLATTFATAWSRQTLRGYTLGPTKNGTTAVILDNLTEENKKWIDKTIEEINNSFIITTTTTTPTTTRP